MSARRFLLLALLVLVAGALVVLVEAPRRRTGEETVRGSRLVRLAADSVNRVVVTIGDRHAAAERVAGRWTADGHAVSDALGDALGNLVETLTGLRAVDRFRPRDAASFGFEPKPRGTVELGGPHGTTRILLGELNGARSAVYARRDGDPHVWLVGLYLISAMERVIYFSSADAAPPPGP
jgi:hypothetical protein